MKRPRALVAPISVLLAAAVAACTQLVLPGQSGTNGTTASASSITSLKALKTAIEVPTGQVESLGLLVVGQDGLVPTSGLVWQSSNSGVVFVDPKTGEARAISAGTTVITVSAAGNPSVRAQIQVTVVDAPKVSLIRITPNIFSMSIGGQHQLVAEVDLPDGTKNGNVLWSSSDSTIATVNATTGQVTALKPGRVTILAAYAVYPQYVGMADLRVLAAGETPPPSPSPTPVMFGPTYSPTTAGASSPTPTTAPTPGPQWSQVFGLEGIMDLTFLSFSEGWAITDKNGYGGRIGHTSDGGITWSFKNLTGVTTLDFVAGGVGWAAGSGGTLFRTTDGGGTWTLTDWAGAGRYDIYVIRFSDASNGLMVTGNGLWKSVDGGASWSQVAPSSKINFWTKRLWYLPNGVAFLLNGRSSGAAGQGLMRYANGILSPPGGGDDEFNPFTFSFPKSTSLAGWASGWAYYDGDGTGCDCVESTSDGGASWAPVRKLNLGTSFDQTYATIGVSFFTPSSGIMLNDWGSYWLTNDNGNSWGYVQGRWPWPSASTIGGTVKNFFAFDSTHAYLWIHGDGSGAELLRLSPL